VIKRVLVRSWLRFHIWKIVLAGSLVIGQPNETRVTQAIEAAVRTTATVTQLIRTANQHSNAFCKLHLCVVALCESAM